MCQRSPFVTEELLFHCGLQKGSRPECSRVEREVGPVLRKPKMTDTPMRQSATSDGYTALERQMEQAAQWRYFTDNTERLFVADATRSISSNPNHQVGRVMAKCGPQSDTETGGEHTKPLLSTVINLRFQSWTSIGKE